PPLHPRDGPRARRVPRHGLPEEVLRLVPRPRPLPEAVQAGAPDAADDRRRRAAAAGGGAGRARRLGGLGGRAARGRRGAARLAADLRLRRRLNAGLEAVNEDFGHVLHGSATGHDLRFALVRRIGAWDRPHPYISAFVDADARGAIARRPRRATTGG